MKKIIFWVLAAAFLLSACAKPAEDAPETQATTAQTQPQTQPATEPSPPDPREALFGDWQYEMSVDGNIMALPDFDGIVTYPLLWSFYKDGTVAVMENRDVYLTAISDFENKLIDFMVDSRYELFVSECNYQGHYSAYIEQEWVTNGLGEQVREEMTETVSGLQLSVRCAPARFLGTYTVEGELITVTDAEGGSYDFTFSVSQEALILTPEAGNTLLQTLNLPEPLILLP